MFNKKSFYLILIMLTSILLFGCQEGPKYDIDDVEDALASLNNYQSIELEYTLNFSMLEESMTVYTKIIVKNIGINKQNVYVLVDDGASTTEIYYVDKHLCTIIDNEYLVQDASDFDYLEDTPFDFDFDITEVEHILRTRISGKNIIYRVKVLSDVIKDLVEDMLGVTLPEMEFGMEIVVTADKATNTLEKLEYFITMEYEEQTSNIEMIFTVVATEDDVELEVPTEVINKIKEFKGEDIEPETPVVYEDTLDGVVKFYNLRSYQKILFDKTTNQLLVVKDQTIDLYDAESMTLNSTIVVNKQISSADVDQGKLVVCMNVYYFNLYDLTNNSQVTMHSTSIIASEIVIDGNNVIYTDYEQWCDIYFHNLETGVNNVRYSLFEPVLTINREDHIVYVAETRLSSTDLYYFSVYDGSKIYQSEIYQFIEAANRPIFDGTLVHHEGISLNRHNGALVSNTMLNRNYPSLTNFTPKITLRDQDLVAFVSSITKDKTLAIYDNINGTFVYRFEVDASEVIEMTNGKYIVVTKKQEHIAIVDVGLIDENLVEPSDEQPVDSVYPSQDGKMDTLKTTFFNKSVIDDKYIYTINDINYALNVYDIDTLEKVYSEILPLKPASIDATDGKLVIAFGNAKQFRLYDTNTWDYETIITQEPVFSIVIYQNRVIYAEYDQWCTVFEYIITSKEHKLFGYTGYYISIAINRKDGIIYFGDRNSTGSDLTYYNLDTNTRIHNSEYSLVYTPIFFDGTNVHYHNQILDGRYGTVISRSNQSSNYQIDTSYSNVNTIFEDGTISIFYATKNNEYVTVVYDLVSDEIIYSYLGKGTNAFQMDNAIVICEYSNQFIRKVYLD